MTPPPHNAPSPSSEPPAASAARQAPEAPLPVARSRPARRISFAWLAPLAALGITLFIVWRAWSMRGVTIAVQLEQGHGLKVGDPVRHLGIPVGEVASLSLDDDLRHVRAEVRLTHDAQRLAVRGTQVWVVRPRLRISGVEGLETLLGPRYIAMQPPADATNAEPLRSFVALPEPPFVDAREAGGGGGLEIVLESSKRGSLHPGAPVLYRGIEVGVIVSVGLSSDAGAVEARAHIQQSYASLIRPQTRFWDQGGVVTRLGLSGLAVEIDSLESLLRGAVALATPPQHEAGQPVRNGHRFRLADEPDDEWLEWQPMAAVGSAELPPGAPLPRPLRAVLAWEQGRIFKGERSMRGWVLPVEGGVLGPANLLEPGSRANAGTAVLEIDGTTITLEGEPARPTAELAQRPAAHAKTPWPAERMRSPQSIEECLIVGDASAAPLPLAAQRLRAATRTGTTVWTIDEALALDDRWHGACVLARADGRLVGLVIVGDDESHVALIPAGLAGAAASTTPDG